MVITIYGAASGHLMMRPARQVKVISSQLENIEFLKKQLEDLIIEIEKIMIRGQSWIDKTDTIQSFTQMSQFLTQETFKCTQKCLDIVDEDKDMSQISFTTEVEKSDLLCTSSPGKCDDNFKDDVKIKLNEIDQWMTKHSKELKNIKQNLKRQEKQNETISSQWIEKDKNTNKKFEDLMKELHTASDFMSKLQSQTDMLTDMKNEHEKTLDKLIIELTVQEVKISDMEENHRSNMENLETVKKDLEKDINSLNVTVQPLKKDVDTVLSEFVSFKASNDKSQWIEKDKNTKLQYDKIMKELHTASDFMTKLQSQTDMLTDMKNEHEKNLDKLILELNVQEVKVSDMTKNHQSRLENLEKFKQDLEKDINRLTVTVQSVKKDVDIVSLESVSIKTSNENTLKVFIDNNNDFQKYIKLQVSSKLDELMKDITGLKDVNIRSRKVSFTVGFTKNTRIPSSDIIKYERIITNIGDCYSAATGIFTCPMDGLYLFHVSLMPEDRSKASVGLNKNFDKIMALYSPYEVIAKIYSKMMIIHLKKNDVIFVNSTCNGDMYLCGYVDFIYNTFTGCLLSAD